MDIAPKICCRHRQDRLRDLHVQPDRHYLAQMAAFRQRLWLRTQSAPPNFPWRALRHSGLGRDDTCTIMDHPACSQRGRCVFSIVKQHLPDCSCSVTVSAGSSLVVSRLRLGRLRRIRRSLYGHFRCLQQQVEQCGDHCDGGPPRSPFGRAIGRECAVDTDCAVHRHGAERCSESGRTWSLSAAARGAGSDLRTLTASLRPGHLHRSSHPSPRYRHP